MSLRMTISSCSSVLKTVTASMGFLPMQEKTSSYILATRLGVSFRPSRLGSSPMASRISRTAFSIRALSNTASTPPDLRRGGLGLQDHVGRHRRRGRRRGGRRRVPSHGFGSDLPPGQDVVHVGTIEHFPLQEGLSHGFQELAVLLEDVRGLLMAVLYDAFDLRVDHLRGLFGILFFLH